MVYVVHWGQYVSRRNTMPKLKLSELNKIEKNIEDFSDRFGCIMEITNKKGKWYCRCTRKAVQIFVVVGDTLFDCLNNASEKTHLKRMELGM